MLPKNMIHAHKFDNVLWSVPPDVIFALIQLSFKLHSREATRHHSVADLVFTSSKKPSTGFTWQPWPSYNNGSFHRKVWLLPFPDYNRQCCLSETWLWGWLNSAVLIQLDQFVVSQCRWPVEPDRHTSGCLTDWQLPGVRLATNNLSTGQSWLKACLLCSQNLK